MAVSIKAKESEERRNIPQTVPFLPLTNEQEGSTYLTALTEATRERRLAALRIAELAKKAENKLFPTF
jgi:hypothetical protein